VGTGLGAGLVLRGELQRGHHGAAGEVDFVRAGLDRDIDPCAAALSAFTERLAGETGAPTTLAPPYDARAVFAAARARDALAREVVDEEARRIALHIVPIASVADVALVVSAAESALTVTSSSSPFASASPSGCRTLRAWRSRVSAMRPS
jgi:predicted NBD/HSP70 family sugar kinase